MSSYIQPQIKTFKSEGVIEKFRFVKFGSSLDKVLKAGAAEKAFGIFMNQHYNAAVNDEIEIAHLGGGALIELADAVSRGDSVTSDANGFGVLGVATNWCAGIAMEDGVAGDVISILLDGHKA